MKHRTPEQVKFINRHMKGIFEHILKSSATEQEVKKKRGRKILRAASNNG